LGVKTGVGLVFFPGGAFQQRRNEEFFDTRGQQGLGLRGRGFDGEANLRRQVGHVLVEQRRGGGR